ncbi:hypothetical protein [Crucivirus-278]|nr:hypothetical protein [Crucivirus-243]QMW68743.1 hypothetical protein [Crucivirus-264]QMW68763.1 hypothetical protein [Crucivirus-278]
MFFLTQILARAPRRSVLARSWGLGPPTQCAPMPTPYNTTQANLSKIPHSTLSRLVVAAGRPPGWLFLAGWCRLCPGYIVTPGLPGAGATTCLAGGGWLLFWLAGGGWLHRPASSGGGCWPAPIPGWPRAPWGGRGPGQARL